MKMSEEMAIKLHRMMWSDMQKELGDTPDSSARHRFKEKWCALHFPDDHISFNCFLCDYCGHSGGNKGCDNCPVEWPDGACSSAFGQPRVKTDYRFAPISEILALPIRNPKIVVDDEKALDRFEAYINAKKTLAEASGLEHYHSVNDHISAIQEKAVDDYFAKMPLAKAITTDVDEAFKQYADEQKAPIFKELAAASGLEELCHDVGKHISAIRKQTADKAAIDQWTTDVNTLKSITKLSYLTVEGFGNALKAKIEDARVLKDLLNKYKDRLGRVSGQDRDKPIDIHLNSIYDSGFTAGKKLAKEEMLKKIEEVLKS